MADLCADFWKEVYHAQADVAKQNLNAGGSAWPIRSDALAVHPKQIKEAMEFDRKNGVPTDYDKYGRPELRDRKHRKRYMMLHGAFDKCGGYGDAQQGDTRLGRNSPPDDFAGSLTRDD